MVGYKVAGRALLGSTSLYSLQVPLYFQIWFRNIDFTIPFWVRLPYSCPRVGVQEMPELHSLLVKMRVIHYQAPGTTRYDRVTSVTLVFSSAEDTGHGLVAELG